MCFSSPAMPAAPPPPPPVTPAMQSPQMPDAPVQQAGDAARRKAAAAQGAMSTIINIGGAQGLTKPASTTAKTQLGA